MWWNGELKLTQQNSLPGADRRTLATQLVHFACFVVHVHSFFLPQLHIGIFSSDLYSGVLSKWEATYVTFSSSATTSGSI